LIVFTATVAVEVSLAIVQLVVNPPPTWTIVWTIVAFVASAFYAIIVGVFNGAISAVLLGAIRNRFGLLVSAGLVLLVSLSTAVAAALLLGLEVWPAAFIRATGIWLVFLAWSLVMSRQTSGPDRAADAP